jgi:hypothetical protein
LAQQPKPAHARRTPTPARPAAPALARPRAKLRSRVAAAHRRRRTGVTRGPSVDRIRVSPGGPRSRARLAITPHPGLHSLLHCIFSSSLPSRLEKPSGSSHRRTSSLHLLASISATAPPFFDFICLRLRLDLRHPVRPLSPSFSLW